jgi:hypothetical protein
MLRHMGKFHLSSSIPIYFHNIMDILDMDMNNLQKSVKLSEDTSYGEGKN